MTSLSLSNISDLGPTAVRQGRFKRILRTLVTFSAGQMTLQIVTALSGLCLVRWLSVPDYAEFGFSLTFQSALGIMVDLGVTSAMIALVGNQHLDPVVLGRYMRAGLSFRARLLIVVAVLGAAVFVFLTAHQGWPLVKQSTVFGIVLVGLTTQFGATIYAVPLILRQRLGTYYGVQAGAGVLRLLSIAGLQSLHMLGTVPALMSGVLASLCVAIAFKNISKAYWISTAPDPQTVRNILRYIAPLAPGTIFVAINGQLVIFIVSYFGAAKSIAEVAALGRLGQLFTLLAAFNGIVLGPRFARVDLTRLKRLYFGAVSSAGAVAGAAACIVLLWPRSLLWVLGPKYDTLSTPFRYVALTGCLGYISSVLWNIHSARQWIYWWSTWLFIGIVIAVQMSGVALLDVGTTLGASKLNFLTSIGILIAQIVVGVYSMSKASRPIPEADPAHLNPAIQTARSAGR